MENTSPPGAAPELDPTNVTVASQIGMSSSGVSRIRVGGRFPSPRVMANIAEVFDWPLSEQILYRVHDDNQGYAREFRNRVFGETDAE